MKVKFLWAIVVATFAFSCGGNQSQETESSESQTEEGANTDTEPQTVAETFGEADTLKYCLTPEGVGIGGYDVVTYFENEAPQLGNPEITFTHEGVTYTFVSEENRTKFGLDPNMYLPQFGGWCSMTLAMGRATTPKYDNYLVQDGKLYLFERTVSVNGKALWQSDPETNEQTASTNYDSYRDDGVIEAAN